MTKPETITPKELKTILDLSVALDLLLLCTINDTIVKIRVYNSWKIKIYECSADDKLKIYNMLNDFYKSRNN